MNELQISFNKSAQAARMKGSCTMGTKYMNFAKGIAVGLAVGAAAVMFMDPLSDKQRHKLQRKTEGVFRSIGGMIDTAMDIMH